MTMEKFKEIKNLVDEIEVAKMTLEKISEAYKLNTGFNGEEVEVEGELILWNGDEKSVKIDLREEDIFEILNLLRRKISKELEELEKEFKEL